MVASAAAICESVAVIAAVLWVREDAQAQRSHQNT